MSIPSDLSGRVSDGLARVVHRVLEDPEREADASLGLVQQAIGRGLLARMVRDGELDATEPSPVHEELDRLVQEVGTEVAAVHLLRYRAPWPLSGVLEALVETWDDDERAPVLGDMRAAIDAGLVTRMLAEGSLDSDVDEDVIPQLDALVRTHGESAFVEDLLAPEDEAQ